MSELCINRLRGHCFAISMCSTLQRLYFFFLSYSGTQNHPADYNGCTRCLFMRVIAQIKSLWNTSNPILENLIRGMDVNGIDGMLRIAHRCGDRRGDGRYGVKRVRRCIIVDETVRVSTSWSFEAILLIRKNCGVGLIMADTSRWMI